MLERACLRSDHCSSLVSYGHHKPPLFVIHMWNSSNDRSIWCSLLELSFHLCSFFLFSAHGSGFRCMYLSAGNNYQECRQISRYKVCSCKKTAIPLNNGQFKLSLPVMLVKIDNIRLLYTHVYTYIYGICMCVCLCFLYIYVHALKLMSICSLQILV